MKKTARPRSLHQLRSDDPTPVTVEFDRELVADSFAPPDKQAQRRWERAKRKPGRPREGQGVLVISVSVEKGLLESADRLAKKKGLSRARIIARGLRAVLAAEGEL